MAERDLADPAFGLFPIALAFPSFSPAPDPCWAAARLAFSASARLVDGPAAISSGAGWVSSLPCTLASTTSISASRYRS